MIIKAHAKINISLDVVGKREDGYHLLEMIMQNIELYDEIELEKKQNGIQLECNVPYIPVDERNLAYKAAMLFMKSFGIKSGVKIRITKNIPVAAGLAGGSSNAAAVLKGMRDLFEVDVNDEELMMLGLNIGADVPYCIVGGTALCKGIGEIVVPLKPFKDHIVVVVKPHFGVSTKEVYGALDISRINVHPDTVSIMKAMDRGDLKTTAELMRNVLENVTLKKHYILREIKRDMVRMGALNSMMSGSGPTVFAFFDDMLKAQKCYDRMKLKYNEVFITRTI
ncbi:MAG: 4-(cytidine 5'-diphospho)-2-C-methyl-D-erythritol kinase [Bacillota bacterium]|nr:4-(cytidine 5'-diphospho)-2-C-methyl-D-erythritol kinase [Bacillota bacterium]